MDGTESLDARDARIATLEKENKSLRSLARFGKDLDDSMAEMVREKIEAGLTSDQAIQVVRDQIENDARVKKLEEAAASKAAKK